MRLADKVILVTGAASGMGRVATRMFAEQGAKVVAADIAETALLDAVAEAGEHQRASIHPVVGNVANGDDVKQMVDEGVRRFGKLNVLYNNAGIMPDEDTSVVETDETTWERVLEVNLKSIYLCCKYGIPAMLDAGGGSIINIASFVALVGCTVPQDRLYRKQGGRDFAHQIARRPIRPARNPGERNLPGACFDTVTRIPLPE